MTMNKYDINAAAIEKTFFRKLKIGGSFLTGNGKENSIVGFSDKSILVKTAKSKDSISISRKKIRQAISYLLFKRTAIRKDLERFTNYNSALMGLLRIILINMARIQKTVNRLLRLTIKGVRFYFSGMDRPGKMDLDAIVKNNATFILNSYASVRNKNCDIWFRKLKLLGIKVVIDCGEYTNQRALMLGKQVEPITVEKYAAFINRYKNYIFAYFNLDVTGDPKQSKLNFNKLKELTEISPIPVWHCNPNDWTKSDWDSLYEMVQEDNEVIAIGATVPLGIKAGPKNQNKVKRALFKEIFNRYPSQNFHWLGGSSHLLLEFPFFSADSSGWLQGRKKQQVYTFEESEKSTRIFTNWSPKECLFHNVRILSSLEEMYKGLQLQIPLKLVEE